jgi:hypothetical protein
MTIPMACMRAIARRTAVTACVMLLTGCAYSVVSGSTVNQAKVDKVEQGIQQIRQLKFLKPVPIVIKDRDQAEQQMEAELMRDYSDNQLHADGTAGAMAGLYPAGMDLKAESLKLLRNQVAGFYDPHLKEMVLVKGGVDLGFFVTAAEFVAQRDIAGEMVLAHELTHALQDQHFDLDQKLDAVKNNDDRGLALKCVAEGDATIAGYAYVSGRMDNSVANALLSHLGEITQAFASQAPGTPAGIAEPLIFQYSDGVRFVAEAYRRGGWSAVDALYSSPPLSTHQIMHPQDYFEHRTPPVEVVVRGYEHALPAWTKVDDDTYGELLLRIILQHNLGKNAPGVKLAQQWAGDQMVVLQSGQDVSLIWIIEFTDAGSAAKFAAVYATILGKLPPTTRHEIEHRGSAVLIVGGAAAQSMQTLAPAVWEHSTIGSARGKLEASARDQPAAAAEAQAEGPH